MNGRGRECEWPSIVTWLSFMASSSADCVLGVVRLISSASKKVGEDGARLKLEFFGLLVVNRHAQHTIARQHVASELQAMKAAGDGSRERLRQRRFAHARNIFDQQVTARQQRR